MISAKKKAKQAQRKKALQERRKQLLDRVGYTRSKKLYGRSIPSTSLPDLSVKKVAPTSDRIVYWSRVRDIQRRIEEGLPVSDRDAVWLKKHMEGGRQ